MGAHACCPGDSTDCRFCRARLVDPWPFPPAEVVQFFRNYFGPMRVAFFQLNPQKQNEYAAELETLWRAQNQATGDRTSVHAEYLEVLARRA